MLELYHRERAVKELFICSFAANEWAVKASALYNRERGEKKYLVYFFVLSDAVLQ